MNLSKAIDLAIKEAEAKADADGYVIGDKEYDTYMSNAEWEAFKSDMPSEVLAEYGTGSGGELDEKNERPPKMASYGSSSRMLYTLSRHKQGFHYEKRLPTTVGGVANLDGFLEDDCRYALVEAKCHEPYSSKSHSISKSYEGLYSFINDSMAGNLEIITSPSKCGRYLSAEFFSDGERLEHFDIKQMICHLLGIATGVLTGKLEQKQIDFIYLLYDPTELDIPADKKEDINAIYERTCYECNLVDMASLLGVIFQFLRQEKYGDSISDEDVENILFQFTFSLASQEFFPILLG